MYFDNLNLNIKSDFFFEKSESAAIKIVDFVFSNVRYDHMHWVTFHGIDL